MTKRTKLWTLFTLATLATGAGTTALLVHGCAQPPRLSGTLNATEQRSQKLLALAAQEAAQITDVDARLTRQLNLADQQINRGWRDDARATLTGARTTLASAEASKLNDHARISGWVSVSELSRTVDDTANARAACDGAERAMRAIEDPAKRCEYVMGIANERQYLDGQPAAGRLLAEAGPWTQSIDHVDRRRQAVVAFAAALFNLDAFDTGQALLRHEPDAAWRSDTLSRLAGPVPTTYARDDTAEAQLAPLRSLSPSTPAASEPAPQFGKTLNYRNVFQGQQKSQTAE